MRTLIIIYILFFAQLPFAIGQKENNNWIFGESIGITFNTSPPSTFTANVTKSYYNQWLTSAVSDAAGNLLFYTDGNRVWNKNQQIMPNGTDITLTPNLNGASSNVNSRDITSVAIIPDPNNGKRYYIIANGGGHDVYNGYAIGYIQPRYSVVDMSMDNGRGDVVPGIKNILLSNDEITVANAAGGSGVCKKWFICKKRFTNELLAYEVTTTGINTVPVSSPIASQYPRLMKFSNDNKKLAIRGQNTMPKNASTSTTEPFYIHLYDFDVTTGQISNGILLEQVITSDDHSAPQGIAFSADNSKLYYSAFQKESANVDIYQFDLSLSASAIASSKTKVYTYTRGANGGSNIHDIMLGPDGKIYCLTDTNTLVVIKHPDRQGIASDARYMIIKGAKKVTPNPDYFGYHNAVPVTNISYSYTDFNTCTLPTQLQAYKDGADSYTWNTGATTQAITANQNGTYWVKAADACGAYRIDTFHVNFSPPKPIGDTFSCNGQPVTIPTDPNASYTWLNGQGPTFTQTGTYAVTISKGVCGEIKDSFKVIIYPPNGTPILPADTTFCNENMTGEISCAYEMGQYTWSTGATGRTVQVNKPGLYWLQCNTPCGIFSDTINVAFCKAELDRISFDETTCSGSCVQFKAEVNNYPQEYNWTFEGGTPGTVNGSTPTAEACYNDTGDYVVTLTVSNAGGNDTKTQRIKVLPKPDGRFADTMVEVTYKTILLLPSCTDATEVSWYKNGELVCNNSTTLQLEAKELSSAYTCIVNNANCYDTCTYNIAVTDIPTQTWLPNAFSPNGDGKNDYFRIITDNPNIHVVDLSVYNRFGQRVYRSRENDRTGWDGNFNSTPVDVGTCFWSLTYKVAGNNEIFNLKGDVVLIR